jgi:hypothetical protein
MVVAACGMAPSAAMAEDIDTNPEADEFQQEVERTAAEYEEITGEPYEG